MMKLTIECTAQQAKIIEVALEEYFRIRMNQWLDVSMDLAFDGNHDSNQAKETDEDLRRRIQCREEMESLFRQISALHNKAIGSSCELSENTRNASDIWSCLRHSLWQIENKDTTKTSYDVRSHAPIQLGTLKLPVITVE